MREVRVRKGEQKDLPELMQLIKDLAEFEKAPEMVTNSVAQLQEDWEVHHAFEFLVAIIEDELAGISLYYPRYSTWQGRCYYLEDLFVKPSHRSQGIGLALLNATAEAARKAGANRLDWQVLDWNSEAVKFYQRIGAYVEKEWWNCKLEL